jgi:hypothetical protein
MIDYNDYIQLWKLSEFANSTGGITVAGFATDLNPDFDLCTSSSSSSSSSSRKSPNDSKEGSHQGRSLLINSSTNVNVKPMLSDPRSEARKLSDALRSLKRTAIQREEQDGGVTPFRSIIDEGNSGVKHNNMNDADDNDNEFINVSDLDALFLSELEEFLQGEKNDIAKGK